MERYRPAIVQVAVQAAVAIGLAVVVGAVWSGLGSRPLAATTSSTLYIAGALWLLGGGSLGPRLTRQEHLPFEPASDHELRDDVARAPRGAPVDLAPTASAVIVALLLVGLGLLLD